ncbi:MAG: ABC-type multidrug transport system, ATPase component CcmA [Candidatus Methanohalarchaeum thermophilum]|uniref:ABC-type multidrug transport system, ATPase component CcmA n=1 Tax=Methanohalarchaeum thermophilum TaxID=1903181 RepID=A0A1Q6DS57_METT1|nr:MAG: ABC-type multidrug transport system, ATPase component CcmA [Candidatus Methanohalarchaeum thermophilum]
MRKDFGITKALKEININIDNFLSLVGPNGAGKTTLIKILSTTMKPTSGTAEINGVDIKKEPIKVREQIGVVSHQTYLYRDLTAKENLKFYARMYDIPKPEKRIKKLVTDHNLEKRLNDRVSEYSRGMKQKLSIIRALLHEPKVLLLDEPYTGLDQHANERLKNTLANFKDKTIIQTTHDLNRALEIGKQIAILSNGKIVYKTQKNDLDPIRFREIYEKKVKKR